MRNNKNKKDNKKLHFKLEVQDSSIKSKTNLKEGK
jgi:hypothetical protein